MNPSIEMLGACETNYDPDVSKVLRGSFDHMERTMFPGNRETVAFPWKRGKNSQEVWNVAPEMKQNDLWALKTRKVSKIWKYGTMGMIEATMARVNAQLHEMPVMHERVARLETRECAQVHARTCGSRTMKIEVSK